MRNSYLKIFSCWPKLSLFIPSISAKILIFFYWFTVWTSLAEKAVYAARAVLSVYFRACHPSDQTAQQRGWASPSPHCPGLILLAERTHTWCTSCAWSIMSEMHSPTDNFPPINCALFFLSIWDMQLAVIYCTWARVCVWDEGSPVEAAEKLDNQNGMMPGGGQLGKWVWIQSVLYEEL